MDMVPALELRVSQWGPQLGMMTFWLGLWRERAGRREIITDGNLDLYKGMKSAEMVNI